MHVHVCGKITPPIDSELIFTLENKHTLSPIYTQDSSQTVLIDIISKSIYTAWILELNTYNNDK